MSVVNAEKDNKSAVRRTMLGFEDFLECLVRCAGLKAWPTDEEIEQTGSGNAGTYMFNLLNEPEAYEELLRTRATPWGDLPEHQPLGRCVDHLCAFLVVTCQGGGGRTAKDLNLTDGQLKWGFQRNKS